MDPHLVVPRTHSAPPLLSHYPPKALYQIASTYFCTLPNKTHGVTSFELAVEGGEVTVPCHTQTVPVQVSLEQDYSIYRTTTVALIANNLIERREE